MNPELTARAMRHLSQLAANGSSLRNQGAPGVVGAARTFLEGVDLGSFVASDSNGFAGLLDQTTDQLCSSFPEGARNWGAARKVLNLFLRDCLYNTYVAEAYGLLRIRTWLEVPLDSQVARGLLTSPLGNQLPEWPGLKYVTPAQNSQYQVVAASIAGSLGVARVDLDLWYWRQNARRV